MFLAIETATDVCSVVFQNQHEELFQKRSEIKGSHSENLFLFMDALMNEHGFTVSDLEVVLVSEGPGSYTGLRIAASGVKGLLFQHNVPLFGMNTLASFAQSTIENVGGPCRIHSIIDARRKHVYYQQFVYDEGLNAESDVKVMAIKQFEENVKKGDLIIGTGLERIEQRVKAGARVFDQKYITARSLISLYEKGDNEFLNNVKPEDFDPKYYTSGQVN